MCLSLKMDLCFFIGSVHLLLYEHRTQFYLSKLVLLDTDEKVSLLFISAAREANEV